MAKKTPDKTPTGPQLDILTAAIQKAFFESPSLIVMDLGLPDITGIDAARTIKENPGSAHIPLIACTAWEKDRWTKQVADVGIAAYLH